MSTGAGRMKALIALSVLAAAAGCGWQTVESSVGDSPAHEIRCPTFVPWRMCVAKADRRFCNDAGARLLRPSPEELDEAIDDGHTVPVEGRIRYRYLVVLCEN